MMWCRAVIVLLLVLTIQRASATPVYERCTSDWDDLLSSIPSSATDAFRDGKYLIAAEIAETRGNPKALAFAARARIADAITREDGICRDCLVKAEATAQAAIGTTTSQNCGLFTRNHPGAGAMAEAYVQFAIAIGFRGRLLGTLDAQSEGLAEKGRAAIDRALELDPLNAWARASLGGWHLEIVHRAGSILASILYGANEEEGLANFRAGMAGDPGSLLLHYHYALSILALDAERFRSEALDMLQTGSKDKRTDALLAFTRKRAERLIETLKTGNLDEIAALVRHYQGYPEAALAEAGGR
jgi:hypothetical protein